MFLFYFIFLVNEKELKEDKRWYAPITLTNFLSNISSLLLVQRHKEQKINTGGGGNSQDSKPFQSMVRVFHCPTFNSRCSKEDVRRFQNLSSQIPFKLMTSRYKNLSEYYTLKPCFFFFF